MYYTKFNTPLCDILLVWDEKWLKNLELLTWEWKRNFILDQKYIKNDVFFHGTKKQILEYINWERKDFQIKLNLIWTNYQKKVWDQLQNISFWTIKTYKKIAEEIWNPKWSRSIWMANSKNPIPLIIPCHRVIWSNWKLTWFAHWLKIKEKLLILEKIKI